MEPTNYEKNISMVAYLLDEINGVAVKTRDYASGMHPLVYGKATKELGDSLTDKLCTILRQTDVSKYSLEMQIWWRDHQIADKKRIESDLKNKQKAEDREKALSKLSPYERKLLGY
jgi:phage-related minor tail protein